MKLIRFGAPGGEQPGIETESGQRLDVSDLVQDYDGAFFAGGGIQCLEEALRGKPTLRTVPGHVRLGPPVCRPRKIICIGLNYRDHAAESGMELPTEPVVFFKATSALCGPNDNLEIPRGAEQTDWEVELAFVVGKEAKYVAECDAMAYVAGYTLLNDYSERTFQIKHCGQWVKGKSCDTFAPLGPIVPSMPRRIAVPDRIRPCPPEGRPRTPPRAGKDPTA